MGDAIFWVKLTNKAGIISLLVAGVSGLVLFQRLPSGLRYLTGLAWFGLAVEIVSFLLKNRHQHNLFLIPIDAAGELWLLSLVYGWGLQWPAYSRVRPWVAGAFVLYAGASGWLLSNSAQFTPALMVTESLLVLMLVGLYFRKLLQELRVQRLSHDSMFWVSTGVLLYFLGKLQIGLFSNYTMRHYSQELNLWMWTIHALLLLILYSCYCLALWTRPQK